MSARTDPLVVNTQDGCCWVRRAWSRDGRGLYALEGTAVGAPDMVLALLRELAEHGLASMADALPVPVGPEPRDVEDELTGARLSLWEAEQENTRLRLALKSAQRGRSGLRGLVRHMVAALDCYDCPPPDESPLECADRWRRYVDEAGQRIAELEAERHVTNEALDDAVQALRADRDRIAELEALVSAATELRVSEPGYGLYVRRRPGGSGFAILEANRTSRGRRAWTTAGWQYSAVLAGAELFCWPDAVSAVSEARRVMPGALVREDEDVTPQVVKLRSLLAGQRAAVEDPHDGPLAHRYRVGRDLPPLDGAR